jgi:hypothetical protein
MNKPPQLYHDTPRGDLRVLWGSEVRQLRIRFGPDNGGNEWVGPDITEAEILDKSHNGDLWRVSIAIAEIAPPVYLRQRIYAPQNRRVIATFEEPNAAPLGQYSKIAIWETDRGFIQKHVPIGEDIPPTPPTRYGRIRCAMPDETVRSNNRNVPRYQEVRRVVASLAKRDLYGEVQISQ